jgi:hypothetical protein
MGTPHYVSWLADYGAFFSTLLSIWHPANTSFLIGLRKESVQLQELDQRFVKLHNRRYTKENPIAIRCFAEKIPMSGTKSLVSQSPLIGTQDASQTRSISRPSTWHYVPTPL